MKKFRFLAMAFAAATMIFGATSCTKDDDGDAVAPELTIAQTNDVNGNYVFAVTCRKGTVDLTTLVIKNAGVTAEDINSNRWDGSNDKNGYKGKLSGESATITVTFSKDLTSKDFTFILTDKDGLSATKTVTATNGTDPNPTDDLSAAEAFTLGRPEASGFPATAMGITWSSNASDGVTANFTVPAGVVILANEAAYNAITTQAQLSAAFTGSVTTFNAKSDGAFTAKYLIVKDGTTLRLVKMTDLKFVQGANKAYFTEKH